jgi:G3E family GTPase
MVVRMAIVGGFLGSGKTTLINNVAKKLKGEGKNIGLIMNDQGEALVDTQYCDGNGFQVTEVLRGCFCCRFNDFITGARSLDGKVKPDFIIAEPVGSCTDLQATVIAPLKTIYAEDFKVAPLMVMVDTSRISSDEVEGKSLGGYLRKHQITEADVIILSKIDMISKARCTDIEKAVSKLNPEAEIIRYSVITGEGLDQILSIIKSSSSPKRKPVDIDYDKYAAAEAELGWYNGRFKMHADKVDSYDLATRILRNLTNMYEPQDIAHAKILVRSKTNEAKISAVFSTLLIDAVKGSRYSSGETDVTLNARIVSNPEKLRANMRRSVEMALKDMKLPQVDITDDCFAPGRPNPTYRMK